MNDIDLTKIKCIITDFDKTLYSDANWKDSRDFYLEYLFEKKLLDRNENKINELIEKYPDYHSVQLIFHVARENGISDDETKLWLSKNIYDFTTEKMRILDKKIMQQLCKKFPVYLLSDSSEKYIEKYLKLFKFNKKWFAGCWSNDYKYENMKKTGMMKRIIVENDLNNDEVIMIGDSFRSDIMPAQELGIQYFQVDDVKDTEKIFNQLISLKEEK